MESVKYIKEDDLKRIREVLKYKNKPVILELINFGVNVALRISDLQKLKFEDITKDNKIILREQKTGKTREIQLNNTCVKSVANLKKVYKELGYPIDSGYIFKSLYRKYVKEKEDYYRGSSDFCGFFPQILSYLNKSKD
ncbi:tyrosine-type recombinase/integrase [Fusobacterium sp.]|uniref:tyrosine-type recombinase/integrase n=1 Tax=Fusobacterium sp. TaxID=68766 RepID=UPI002903F8AC|nr:tyrosine-type recombinase/integrase [Fusobacterium sp.]MDU1912664.1 tyrosine-type recombinase/integrase [Fusobacterium sp.]